jgi:RNA polymerase sigma-54 factor
LEENPLLEETAEADEIRETEQAELAESEETPDVVNDDFKEVEAGDDTLRDWDSYLDGYTYSSGEQYRDDEDRPSFENLLTRQGTLTDHLLWQLNMGDFSVEEVRIGEEIIGNVDEDGYLRASLEEIATACSIDENGVTPVLVRIQEFDPCGVAARSVQECLLIQARFLGMQGSVVEKILLHNLKDLETRKYKQIARDLGVDINQILMAAKIIGGFDPKPGSMYSPEDVQYISADIFVYKVGDEYLVMLNDEGLPNLKVSPYYAEAKSNGMVDSKADEYINEKVRSALWLIKSIQQRQRTIYKVAKSIIRFQREFLDQGIEFLRPLVLRDVADDIGMHESTISRVTTNKYMQTPQGLFELKYFFNSGLSTSEGDFVASESVKNRIREIIEKEDTKKPLSDQKIADMLSGQTVNIARRTVTKYREILKLGSSSERKRHF